MRKNEINTGDGSPVIASPQFSGDHVSISNSFNEIAKRIETVKSSELKAKLTDLHATVKEMCDKLPSEPAKKDAVDALDTLTKEATREQPRQKWYDVSAQGLIEAANAVGEVGTKVVGLVKGVAVLLGLAV